MTPREFEIYMFYRERRVRAAVHMRWYGWSLYKSGHTVIDGGYCLDRVGAA